MKDTQNNMQSLKSRFFRSTFSSYLMIIAIFITAMLISCAVYLLFPPAGLVTGISLSVISLCLSIWLSYSRSKKISDSLISLAEKFEGEVKEELDLISYIDNESVKALEQNASFKNAINEKDSLLQGIFLQSRMRDIYVSLDDVEAQLADSKPFVMVYFRVHYKEAFYQTIREEPSKSTFFLKQLIELYFSSEEHSSSTFQVENDKIVSIISAENGAENIVAMVESAMKKLENESDYVFFTVVISKLNRDISSLKPHFDQLSRLARYAMPIMENQILMEESVAQGTGQFYFTVEQMEKLSSLMQNGATEECIRNLNEILDYNVKKEVNGFDLYLLCTEIVNCAVKLLNRLFHSTPASLNLSRVYVQLDRAVTVDQYQDICSDLIRQVTDYISFNKREEDYIINFILDYVENHYAEDIYLNLFADKLALTSAYISSYFKEKMNVNLTDYLNSFRIKKAITLIANPQYKNKDVAEAVGLQNINTFIRLFKKYTGYTPGEYRKKHFNLSDDL